MQMVNVRTAEEEIPVSALWVVGPQESVCSLQPGILATFVRPEVKVAAVRVLVFRATMVDISISCKADESNTACGQHNCTDSAVVWQ
mmetsp:Transcript_35751/g.64850  ORF Transcript_35751/g.64850 Transcript_35751/m.64850 type:complete len:87 (+) Transcript_35751:270-530(+)